MDRYMGIFATSGAVQEAVNNDSLHKPYIAIVQDGNYLDWNTKEKEGPVGPVYSAMPLTFEILSAGNIYWKAQNGNYTKTIDYKKNEGEWTSITSTSNGVAISVVAGDILQFRGDNAQYAPEDGKCNTFTGSTARFNVYGNIMSMISSTGFTGLTAFTQPNVFMNFFNNCVKMIDASNLILPAIGLSEFCYQGMFANCTGLTSGTPVFSATELVTGCYNYLFYQSRNVSRITCLGLNPTATTSAANSNVFYITHSVSSTGTFIKNPNATNWRRDGSGIPSNWTVVDADI